MEEQGRTIHSAQELFALIDGSQAIDFEALSFDGWPAVDIKIHGDRYNGEITPELAKALYDFSQHLKRAYAAYKYGSPKVSALKADDLALFADLTFHIGEGCTEISAKFADAFHKMGVDMAAEAFSNMESHHIAAVLVALGVIAIGGYVGLRAYTRRQEAEEEKARIAGQNEAVRATGEAVRASLEENRRMFNQAMSLLPNSAQQRVNRYGDQVEEGYAKIVQSAADADQIDIGTNTLDKAAIEGIASPIAKTTESRPMTNDPVIVSGIIKNIDKQQVTVTAHSNAYPEKPITLKYIAGGLDTEAEKNLHQALEHNSSKRAKISYNAVFNAETGEYVQGTLTNVGDLVSYHLTPLVDEDGD